MDNDLIEIARIANPKGLKGHLWIVPYGESFERFSRYNHLILGKDQEPRKVLSCSEHKGKYEIALEGITDISRAEALKGVPVFISRGQLEEPGEDEYYWHDLLGMTVQDLNGRVLGELVKIFNTGSNDVYVVDPVRQYYIPATKDVIREVSLDRRTVTIDAALLGDLID